MFYMQRGRSGYVHGITQVPALNTRTLMSDNVMSESTAYLKVELFRALSLSCQLDFFPLAN